MSEFEIVFLSKDNDDQLSGQGSEIILVKLANNQEYKLTFCDYYQLTEDIFRQRDYFEVNWFSNPLLVIVNHVNIEFITQSVEQLITNGDLQKIRLNSEIQENPRNTTFNIEFPEWFIEDDDEKYLAEVKGYLDEVVVSFEKNVSFEINFEDYTTFVQKIGRTLRKNKNHFGFQPDLCLVPKIDIALMQQAIIWLATETNYFQILHPI